MQATPKSTTVTTVKVFEITDAEPQMLGHYKTPTLITKLVVTYVSGNASWKWYGRNVLNGGAAGVQSRDGERYWVPSDVVADLDSIADKHSPWSKK